MTLRAYLLSAVSANRDPHAGREAAGDGGGAGGAGRHGGAWDQATAGGSQAASARLLPAGMFDIIISSHATLCTCNS